jgi:HlyD family secretion protein
MTDEGSDLARVLATGRPKRRLRLLWLALVPVVALGGWLWLASGSSDTKITYTTDPVTQGNLVVTVTATGTVEPTTEVEVSSELSGKLATVDVTYNDTVTEGQVLASLDDTKLKAQVAISTASLEAARGQVASAEATLRETQEALVTQSELDRRGVTSRTTLTSAQATRDRAAAQLDIARANLTLAEANLDLDRADLDKAVIRSPIRGVVLSRDAEPGQIVAASLEAPVLFTLAEDLSQMELLVDIDEADIGVVRVGNAATFTVDAYDGKVFPAEITQVRYAPETTDSVVTYKAVLKVENPDGLLRPGMTATATITVNEVRDTLTIANAALRYAPPETVSTGRSSGNGLLGLIMPARPQARSGRATGDAIWVLRDGVPAEVPVKRLATDGNRTAVTAEGLQDGDRAITAQSGGN